MSNFTASESIPKDSGTESGYKTSITGVIETREQNTASYDSEAIKYKRIKHGLRSTISEKRERKPPVVLRKFNGYFVQQESESALVVLFCKNESYKYYLPFKDLKSKGIHLENQPFEMIELRLEKDGVKYRGYDYRPLATKKESYNVTIDFDEETKKKLDYIIANAPKPKD